MGARHFLLLLLLASSTVCLGAQDWEKDIGKPAPSLMAAGWVGTPVSLDAVRGNTTVLAFWNGDIAC